jgi:hypothetical protein
MTTAELNDKAWRDYPYTYRNNRGCVRAGSRFIRYGIPEPKGNKEDDDAMKGGDRIGFSEVVITADMVGKTVAVFTSIEVKGDGDRLKSGQIRWHNFVLKHGGISEIRKGNGEIIRAEIE